MKIRHIAFWAFCASVIILGGISYQSHAEINALRMKEQVAEHKKEWIAYHEPRELKRAIDAQGLWDKPEEILKLTIYNPELFEKANDLHQKEKDKKEKMQ